MSLRRINILGDEESSLNFAITQVSFFIVCSPTSTEVEATSLESAKSSSGISTQIAGFSDLESFLPGQKT